MLEPYRRDEPRLSKIERLPFRLDGKPSTAGVVLRYVAEGVVHQALMCPRPGVKRGGGWTTTNRSAAGTFGVLR